MKNEKEVQTEIMWLLTDPDTKRTVFDGEAIAGYLIMAEYEGGLEELRLRVYKWDDLYRALEYYKELEDTEDAVGFTDALNQVLDDIYGSQAMRG